jgi:hypothetical protein
VAVVAQLGRELGECVSEVVEEATFNSLIKIAQAV